jgi:hypothetical protein
MPDGLERDLSQQDFADVCTLLTQRATSGETQSASLAEVAQQVLDDARPRAEREALIAQQADRPAELVAALAAGLAGDTQEEYRRIPWIWRVAVAAGKKNDTSTIKSILQTVLPAPQAPLADWQAVVVGGGVVNGISLSGAWPHERIAEIIGNDAPLKTRWRQSLEQAAAMAEREATPTGTRYDALRMIALEGWARHGADLTRYLSAEAHAELQMGAVSGLVDVPDPQATTALIDAIADLKPRNRELALDGLMRSEARMLALLDAVAAGRVSGDQLGASRKKRLLESSLPTVKQRATAVLSKSP